MPIATWTAHDELGQQAEEHDPVQDLGHEAVPERSVAEDIRGHWLGAVV